MRVDFFVSPLAPGGGNSTIRMLLTKSENKKVLRRLEALTFNVSDFQSPDSRLSTYFTSCISTNLR